MIIMLNSLSLLSYCSIGERIQGPENDSDSWIQNHEGIAKLAIGSFLKVYFQQLHTWQLLGSPSQQKE